MSKIKYIQGNMVDLITEFDVSVHGANCFCRMKSGIAPQIADMFDGVREQDNETIPGDKSKVGTISYANYEGFTIINAYTQYNYGPREGNLSKEATQEFRENALRKAFKVIYQEFGNKGNRFLIPKIGAGLAGGDWSRISKIIEEELPNEDITCVIYRL